MNFIKKNWEYLTLAGLVVVSLALHVYRISYPDVPLFDEFHFATYAADYASHRPFFDIHPPLGKLIYAGALSFFPKSSLAHSQFVSFTNGPGGGVDMKVNSQPYGNYPYVALRLVSVFFGICLPLVFYWFLRAVGFDALGAILGAFFITFENALLIDTRLILLDGMYLVFGFAALALYFDAKRSAALAGAVLGFSLGVKLIGIVFVIPAIAAMLTLKKAERKNAVIRFLKFMGTALVTLMIVFALQGVLFSPQERISALVSGGFLSTPQLASELPAMSRPAQYVVATIVDGFMSLRGYTTGNAHTAESPWYFWPAMLVPITYYISGPVKIILQGNPIVWLMSTLAVICGLAVLPRYLWAFMKGRGSTHEKQVAILLSGYIGSMIPYFTIIHRSTFLYHYFPALLFGIGLLSLFLSSIAHRLLEHRRIGLSALYLAAIGIVTVGGFVFIAPVTYGFSPWF